MIRGPRRITLTEEGLFLKKRAEEILSLASHTEEELRSDDTELDGNIRIGSAEADSVRFIMQTAHKLQNRYKNLHFHVTSGDGQAIMEALTKASSTSPSSTAMSIRKNMRSCTAHTLTTGASSCSAAIRWQPGK